MSYRTKVIFVFVVLGIGEIVSRVIYYFYANRWDERCYEHNDELRQAGEVCSHIAYAASHAFSTASLMHLPIIVATAALILPLISRLDKLEKKVEELGGKRDV